MTAAATITDAAKLGDALQLGLLCTEYYDVKQDVYTKNGSHEQRVLKSAEAYTTWNELDRATVQQSVRFTVPATSPFSYEGGTVSWAWHVALAPGSLAAGMCYPFRVALPMDALPGQSGAVGSTSWGVHARADRRGIDFHAWHPFALAEA